MSELSTQTSPKPPAKWKVGAVTIALFVGLLYLIEAWDSVHNQELNADGIRPLETDGLSGILWAPLLHANWQHLFANTGPAVVLGFLVTLCGLGRFVVATAIIWIGGGLGTWLIGNIGAPHGVESVHIGASGLIFGWLTFLIVYGFFTRRMWQILVGLAVMLVYGGVLWGMLPGTFGVSWQAHTCGAIAGVCAAYVVSAPERKRRELHKGGQLPRLQP
ncbi:membrane associated rhomboid family serine protease [Mycobacterium sp. MAA66]|uniref:rhomboid family intramembrane serine protease n=1 Tax=Mycobacterium sp. MAA66 TaxID=3156297 RepID=UPI003518E652